MNVYLNIDDIFKILVRKLGKVYWFKKLCYIGGELGSESFF